MGYMKLVLGLLVAFALSSEAKVTFKNTEFEFAVPENTLFDLDLVGMLSEYNKDRPLVWLPGPHKPQWVRVDDGANHIYATPSSQDVGKFRFPLTVSQFDTEATAFVTFTVYRSPKWKTPEINLGRQQVGQPFQFDLSTWMTNPDTLPIVFSATNLPPWMKIASDGIVSGIPREGNLGRYEGIVVRAQPKYGPAITVTATGLVAQVSELPSWTSENIPIGEAKEGQLFSKSIASLVRNPEGLPLKFSLLGSHPEWVNFSEGVISGTPRRNDVGTLTLRAEFTTQVGAIEYRDSTILLLEILKVERPPSWVANPVMIGNGNVGQPFRADLGTFVNNADGLPWLMRAGWTVPGWLSISSRGLLTGTPTAADKGDVSFEVELIAELDHQLVKIPAVVKFTVVGSNTPPRWEPGPHTLPDAMVNTAYHHNLTALVQDPDVTSGDVLQFSLLSTSGWASVSPSGVVSGTPLTAQAGEHRLNVRVTDRAGESDEAVIIIRVPGSGNRPPVIQSGIALKIKERAIFSLSLNDPRYANDPDNDRLTFELLTGGEGWVTLAGDGKLEVKPRHQHLGTHRISLRVSDGKSSTDGSLELVIEANPRPPIWLQDPLEVEVSEGTSFNVNLVNYARDLDGLPLTFRATSAPAWVTVSGAGLVSGRPTSAQVGVHLIKVEARNSAAAAEASLRVRVRTTTRPLIYHVGFLINFQDSLNCTLMKRGVDEVILNAFRRAAVEVVILNHTCNSGYQYVVRILSEGADATTVARLNEVKRQLHGSLLMGSEIRFSRMTRFELTRHITLRRGHVPTYGTGYSTQETFFSPLQMRDAIHQEKAQVSAGSYSLLLSFVEKWFPTKAEEFKLQYPASDHFDLTYGMTMVDTNEFPYSFTLYPSDLVTPAR